MNEYMNFQRMTRKITRRRKRRCMVKSVRERERERERERVVVNKFIMVELHKVIVVL